VPVNSCYVCHCTRRQVLTSSAASSRTACQVLRLFELGLNYEVPYSFVSSEYQSKHHNFRLDATLLAWRFVLVAGEEEMMLGFAVPVASEARSPLPSAAVTGGTLTAVIFLPVAEKVHFSFFK
jgi:hypothetical protein